MDETEQRHHNDTGQEDDDNTSKAVDEAHVEVRETLRHEQGPI